MDDDAVLAAYNQQVRRNPPPSPGTVVERDAGVVRVVSPAGGWSGIVWSDLDGADVDAVIAAQITRFAEAAQPWEWKHYSYDLPTDLPQRLRAAGLQPDPAEALLVAEIADLALDAAPPAGVELVPVVDERGAAALVRVHDEVFGGDHARLGRLVLEGLRQRPPAVAAVLAVADGVPIGGGRVEFAFGTDFAGLWGGGTVRAWRGRGVFRSLVAQRAALARSHGFRYLQVDASPDSRPILRRLGFAELATTTPYRRPDATPLG